MLGVFIAPCVLLFDGKITVKVREVDVMLPENQAVAYRLGFYWSRWCDWKMVCSMKMLSQNDEDEILVDKFVYLWSYCQARERRYRISLMWSICSYMCAKQNGEEKKE